jgi:hypothetical protein
MYPHFHRIPERKPDYLEIFLTTLGIFMWACVAWFLTFLI